MALAVIGAWRTAYMLTVVGTGLGGRSVRGRQNQRAKVAEWQLDAVNSVDEEKVRRTMDDE